MATKAAIKASEKEEARATLRELIGDTPDPVIHTVLRHVSSSGMSRDISLLFIEGGKLRNITWLAARALGETPKERKGRWVIRVNGCGMDMGFHLVSSLSYALFRDRERPDYVIRHEWA